MTTTAPKLNSRDLGLAHYAARAVLERVLARYGIKFQQMVTLRLVAVAEAPVDRAALVGEVVDALKADETDVQATVEELTGKGLLEAEATQVRITDSGRKLYAEASAESGEISARVWGGIPEEDLATAGRVLALVTSRANAELTALK